VNIDRPELLDRLASEYVVGTLQGGARRRFQRLLRRDASVQRAVQSWERRLTPLAAQLSAPMPSARVWTGIQARLRPASPEEVRASGGWLARFIGWRIAGALAAGVVLGVALMQVLPIAQTERVAVAPGRTLPEIYAGFLQDAQGPVMLISSPRHGKTVDVKLVRSVTAGPGRVLELWALFPDKPPLPLGVVPASGKGQVALTASAEQLLASANELAVSIERPNGPPPERPSGSFILRGPCAKFW